MHSDMNYNGKKIEWAGYGSFNASSGLPHLQKSSEMCNSEGGPLPEGHYKIYLTEMGSALDDGKGICNLQPAWGIQTIPRGAAAGHCEPYWANWGVNRARMEPADNKTKNQCSPIMRGGFYLHDSVKGFSHGCIEVDTIIFSKLRAVHKQTKKRFLIIKVVYDKDGMTYGNTKK